MSNTEVMKLEEDKDLKGEFEELCKALRNKSIELIPIFM